MDYSFWDVLVVEADVSEDPAGGTLVDRPEWLADVALGISSAMEFPIPLVKVAMCICGRTSRSSLTMNQWAITLETHWFLLSEWKWFLKRTSKYWRWETKAL